jgi:predicted  nucleic acid-binding Zn-ribbon protein
MRENLNQLIKLQNIDSQLQEIEELKGDLPTQVERLTKDLENLGKSITRKGERRKEIHKERSLLESSLGETRQHLKKYQDQLLLVSTNRAYDALMTEIDSAKKHLEDGEFHLLELTEEEVRTGEELKAEELMVKDKRAQLEMQKKSLQTTIAETETQTRFLKKQRRSIQAAIEPRYLRIYERISAARDGQAVVAMSRGSCGVCFNRIPQQRQVEIKAGNKIITCDSCGVILYWDGDN